MRFIEYIERNIKNILYGIVIGSVLCIMFACLMIYSDIANKYADIKKMKYQAELEISEMKAKARHGILEERIQKYMLVYYGSRDEKDRMVLKEWMMEEFKDIDDEEINDIKIRLFVDQVRREE